MKWNNMTMFSLSSEMYRRLTSKAEAPIVSPRGRIDTSKFEGVAGIIKMSEPPPKRADPPAKVRHVITLLFVSLDSVHFIYLSSSPSSSSITKFFVKTMINKHKNRQQNQNQIFNFKFYRHEKWIISNNWSHEASRRTRIPSTLHLPSLYFIPPTPCDPPTRGDTPAPPTL